MDFNEFKIKIENHAEEKGFKINPKFNLDVFPKIKEKHGDYYCPCVPVAMLSDKEKQEKLCPCVGHENDVRRSGKCHCNLFLAN